MPAGRFDQFGRSGSSKAYIACARCSVVSVPRNAFAASSVEYELTSPRSARLASSAISVTLDGVNLNMSTESSSEAQATIVDETKNATTSVSYT